MGFPFYQFYDGIGWLLSELPSIHTVSEVLTAVGTCAVAIVAIWQDQIINFLNPVKGSIQECNFKGREEGIPQMQWGNYHVKAVSERRWRPLRGCAIKFKQISRTQGTVESMDESPVWRQLPWAPAERTEPRLTIIKEQEADLGQYRRNSDDFCFYYYAQGGQFNTTVRRGEIARIRLHLTADNLFNDSVALVTVDMTGTIGTPPCLGISSV